MIYRLVLYLSLLGAAVFVSGQKLPSKPAFMPEGYEKPFLGIEAQNLQETTTNLWKVYSDRSNNKTYTTPGGPEVIGTLDYMQAFYVAEIQGEYMHIYKEPGATSAKITPGAAKSYGWIHKNNLLLWQHCLIDSENHQNKKAMVLNTFEGISSDLIENQIVEYKMDPELSRSTGRQARMFEILFVYKILEDVVLLAEDVGIYGTENDVKGLVRGWVPKSNVTFWDHRFTLEPNWEPAAYAERRQNGITPAIFSDARAALDYQKKKEVSDTYRIWSNEPGDERNSGQWRRFPILDSRTEGLYKAGAMGKIKGQDSMSVERYAEIRELTSSLEQKARRINVVFVVDGTESMGKYYKSISDGLIKSVNILKSDDTQNRFRFGAVIYRDKAEGDHLVELLSLHNDHSEVTNFLSGARTDYSNDTDAPEAMYYGLKKAITSSGFSKNETNFIILVGDAGNHNRDDETRLSETEIIKLAAEYECSFICFQANNGQHETYDDFIAQAQRLVLGTANLVHSKLDLRKEKWRPYEYETPYFVSSGPNQYSLNNQEIVGSFLFPDKGSVLPYSNLQKEISDKITGFDSRTSIIIQESKKILSGHELKPQTTDGEVFEFSEAVVGFLSKIKGLSNNEIDLLRMRNYQFSMDGYTSKKVESLNEPIFKEVLFLSANDMSDMLASLQRLISGYGNMNQKRKQMQDTWLDLLRGQVGSIVEEEVLAMSVTEISEMIYGLPVQSKFLKDVLLKDITEPTIFNDRDFENYLDYFRGKLNVLRSYVTEGYRESFFSNGMRYYWIPLEDFP